ncbi:aspartate aminotransferase family protein [Pseudomonas sp. CFBP 8770]|uniref:aspartate aminotransferase family protein n=1 Tax=unclassified Pseudomonas TaxID=196821 RepID=UPI00177F4CAF|nr:MULTISPECIES: aspartate aminotransferase family protein [unclassified Pseudomonas]MBD8473987.1 aspartate aminotransferase family protein [Pseudomonas sp. CFBP 8773]MBD8647116.1 aspartate aminotransferase family protein [Pseudomonas sp. CFBP 8770]
MSASHLMPTYQPLPLMFSRGLGTRLWDDSGREYLDALAGVAVTNVGHSHPDVVAAITEQAGLLLHTSNLYAIDWQQQLGAKLAEKSGLALAFFNNSGAEANETALKLARLHGHARGIARPLVVVMNNAFHGRTLATLAASDGAHLSAGLGQLPGDCVKIPFADLDALANVTQAFGQRIAAVLLEPIQGESGVHVASAAYLRALREHCDHHGWLLMLDEIQSGIGRTGQWFAYQHAGIQPDVITLAKALGNGIPIGACLASAAVGRLFTPGSHGSTFGGNPLACRVGCTVLDIIERERLLDNAARQGRVLLERLRSEVGNLPGVKAVRGMGLMIGIELDRPCRELMQRAAQEHALLINVTRGTTLRLLPPLTLNNAEVERIVATMRALLQAP